MPPSIAQLTDESDADLDSIETKIEKNMKDIAYLKASSDPPALEILFLTNLQSEQRNFTERLETLHESQQKLLTKLNAIKSKNYIQEINNLRAEKQLLQQDSGILSGEDAPDTAPTPDSRTFSLPSSKNKRKAAIDNGSASAKRRVKSESASLDSEDESDQDLSHGGTANQSPAKDAVSNAAATDVTIWLNLNNELELADEENEATVEAWKRDGSRLREEWKKQLREFNKKKPDWPNYFHSGGCVRSALWNQGRCYLTIEGEGEYACKTCWNTGHFCIAYDGENDGYFWLRPQLPAARAKGKSNIGPFYLERFLSMKTTPSRTDLPAYWKKDFTA